MLPRPPDDAANLQRLREEARQRMSREERMPAPVYGGPPPPRRGWSVRGFVLLLIAMVAAIVGWLVTKRPIPPAAVYGGPPPGIP